MEVYDATAALQYNVTDVVLREEVLPLNIASFDGVKGDMMRSGKVKYSLDCGMFNDGCNDGDSDGDAKM
ncbi:hypothetical protein HBI31_031030 [Parastagonospora nodorum]|nr:hypothetical protein HBI31_031030 [Parastagonospora nodorum]